MVARRKASGEHVVIGLNKFVESAAEAPIEIHRVDPEVEARQIGRLRETRARRDQEKVTSLLNRLAEQAVDPSVNLMPVTIELVKARASMGEIVNCLLPSLVRTRGPGLLIPAIPCALGQSLRPRAVSSSAQPADWTDSPTDLSRQ